MLTRKKLLITTAIFFGILANASLKHTNGFTKTKYILLCGLFVAINCLALSNLMKTEHMGPIFSTYAACVTLFLYCYGLLIYKEIPTYSSMIGALFIIIGVFLVNNK